MANLDGAYFEKIMTAIIIIFLIILSFFLLKPILLAIITGLLLAFIFTPAYRWIYKKTKSKNLSATIIIVFLALIIIIPSWFLIPILITQSLKVIQATLQIDFVSLLKDLLPGLFRSEQLSAQISSSLTSFMATIADSITGSLTYIILNFPTLLLQLLVVFFTFFFVLRDQEEFSNYVKSLLPFPKEIERKLFTYSTDITKSVLFGQIIIGIIQGIIAGIGFIIFGVPNALFLMLLAIFMGIFPIVGTPVIWIPVAIYMFMAGNNFAGWGVCVFGIISSTIDNILRPIFVSKMTRVHSGIVLISMVGGLFLFGILGLLIGPLIVAYLLIILELYRKKSVHGLIIQEAEKSQTK